MCGVFCGLDALTKCRSYGCKSVSGGYSEPKLFRIIYLFLTSAIPHFISGIRSIFTSLSIAAILPMVQAYGVLFTNTVSAILAWGGFGYVEIHPSLLSGRSYRNLTRFTLR